MPKIVDCHTHLGNNDILKGSVEDLLRGMDVAGVDRSIVFSGDIFDCPTDRALDAIQAHRDRLSLMGSVSFPYSGNNPFLHHKSLLETGDIVGMKFYVGYEPYYPWDQVFEDYLSVCDLYDRPVVFHCGDLYSKASAKGQLRFCHPLEIDRVAAEHPGLKIVIAHMGNPFLTETSAVLLSKPNVYADLSGFVTGTMSAEASKKFQRALQHVHDFVEDPSKFMFGSDWPICETQDYLIGVQGALIQCGFTLNEIDKVMGKTAAKVFGVKL